MKPAQAWQKVPEWGKAFLLAALVLLVMHLFVLRWVTVRSTSMYATLLPGDLVGVERWPIWTGFQRGDIAVFHDPVEDDRPMGQRQLLVKRIVAVPGDVVQLRNGQLFVNDLPVAPWPHQTSRWAVQLAGDSAAANVLGALGLPADYVLPGHRTVELPLNPKLAEMLEKEGGVTSATPRGSSRAASDHLFPFGPNYRWNNDNYGPLALPAEGDTVEVTLYNLPIYDRIISRYEHNRLEVGGRELRINGVAATRYVTRQDYYFVLGDSRDNSSDSRYWGFLPEDHLVGRAAFVLLNAGAARELGGRSRFLLGLDHR